MVKLRDVKLEILDDGGGFIVSQLFLHCGAMFGPHFSLEYSESLRGYTRLDPRKMCTFCGFFYKSTA